MAMMSISEARAELPDLVTRVAEGEEVTITRYGRPAAILVRREIAAMLGISTQVSDTVKDAVTSADRVSEYVGHVAGALEQQSVATREISGSVQQASRALADIDLHVKKIASR